MAITEEQREERKKFLGSSDVSALFTDNEGKSLDPFNTAVDIWASKVYELEPGKETKAMSRGNRHELAMIGFAEEELGCEIITNPDVLRFICKDHPVFACNLDGFTCSKNGGPHEIVEVKTQQGDAAAWGEPGTDDVPVNVNLQVQQQMLCTGWKKAHVSALLGKKYSLEEMYVVERNEKIIDAIIDRGEQFWNDNVLTKIPPPATEVGNIEIFKRIVRLPETYADMDPKIIIDWELIKQHRLFTEKQENKAFATLLAHLGDAEGAKLDDGRVFTYFQQTANRVDVGRLQAEYPTIYDAVLKESKSRVARIRKGK